jgi:hypothetical protein
MKTVATGPPEMLVTLYQTTQDHIFADCSLFHIWGWLRPGLFVLQLLTGLQYQIWMTGEQTSYIQSKKLKLTEIFMFVCHQVQHTSSVFILHERSLLFPDANNQQYSFTMRYRNVSV